MIAQVISLARRPDRRLQFAQFADAAGLQYEFIDAVDGQDGVPIDWVGAPGAYGCAQSHARLLSAGTGEVLVMEDDAVVPSDFLAHLDAFRAAVPSTWSLLKLGGQHTTRSGLIAPSVAQCTSTIRTHAYLVSADARPALARIASTSRRDWDAGYAGFANSFAPDPFLVPASGGLSDIESTRPW